MKFIKFFLVLSTVGMLFACNNTIEGEKAKVSEAEKVTTSINGVQYNVVADNASINWTGSKLTGKHNGTIKVTEGELAVNNGAITGGQFAIEMSSISNNDLEGEYKTKLETHLKSPDFFDVENYPTSMFEIIKVEKLDGDAEATHMVNGNLTIKGITKAVSFKANVDMKDDMVMVTSPSFIIDRTDFNVKYGSTKFFENLKDKAVHDEMGLSLNLKLSADKTS